ncbi:Hypothetical predicted protein [Mytilus galloprovincialis]|uniref:Farnesoic acid O-methyl transferase domain-containing protein n=1 Tax=Mytilus galloprovincialis TaxID=29158 RepID=A0A8B6HB35_MYTGA|nr:Hypothetical predicted protein [Mytilus galloprovincialis]
MNFKREETVVMTRNKDAGRERERDSTKYQEEREEESNLVRRNKFYYPNTRSYTIVSNLGKSVDDRLIIFKVKACEQAYVGLMSGQTESNSLHEIVFGGDANTASFIRAGNSFSLPDLVRRL